MAILGLTVTESGEAIQRLAVTTKVAIGEVVKTATGTRPAKLDHFIFLRKGNKLEWEPDQDLMKHYTVGCREFSIILLDDEVENVFRTEYAWWSKTEKKCWGDGRAATRRTQEHPDGQPWTPCGDGCPELDKNICKPSGDLYFILADFPRLGAVCRLHTTSYRSIRQINSAIEQIRTVTGGRLAGIRCSLVVRPEKAAYFDEKKNQKVSTTIYALNIELSAQGMQKLISTMTENAKLFEQTKKLLGDGRKVEYVAEDEPEVERAPDIAQEFYPAEDIAPAATAVQQPSRTSAADSKPITLEGGKPVAAERIWPKPGDNNGNGQAAPTVTAITKEQRQRLYAIVNEHGYSNTQVRAILEELWGLKSSTDIGVDKYDEIVLYFQSDGQVKPAYKATDEDVPW